MGITTLRLLVPPRPQHGRTGSGVACLAKEFPTVELALVHTRSPEQVTIELDRWLDRSNDFAPFDAAIDDLVESGPATLVLQGPHDAIVRAGLEMLTRWQRHIDRRNAASRTPAFDAVIRGTRALHDRPAPLVRADWNHALDTWQWTLRLDPNAGAAVQMAALLHDVERLESEADARIEHRAPNYQQFKMAHARRGAEIARRLLEDASVERDVIARVTVLVAVHESTGDDSTRALLNDADALSFFSQNSAGYLDYFGPAQTAHKVAYTLGRMRPSAIERIGTFRLRADVAEILARAREGTAA